MFALVALMLGCGGQDTTVVVMNNGDAVWEGMTILVNGSPACKADLAPGQTVTATTAGCELSEVLDAVAAPDKDGDEDEVAGDEGDEGGDEEADEPKKLNFKATVSGGVGPARRIGVINQDGFTWHTCTVTLNGKYTYRTIASLSPGEHEGIMGQKFKSSGGDMMTKNHQIKTVFVSCAEGSGSRSPQ